MCVLLWQVGYLVECFLGCWVVLYDVGVVVGIVYCVLFGNECCDQMVCDYEVGDDFLFWCGQWQYGVIGCDELCWFGKWIFVVGYVEGCCCGDFIYQWCVQYVVEIDDVGDVFQLLWCYQYVVEVIVVVDYLCMYVVQVWQYILFEVCYEVLCQLLFGWILQVFYFVV